MSSSSLRRISFQEAVRTYCREQALRQLMSDPSQAAVEHYVSQLSEFVHGQGETFGPCPTFELAASVLGDEYRKRTALCIVPPPRWSPPVVVTPVDQVHCCESSRHELSNNLARMAHGGCRRAKDKAARLALELLASANAASALGICCWRDKSNTRGCHEAPSPTIPGAVFCTPHRSRVQGMLVWKPCLDMERNVRVQARAIDEDTQRYAVMFTQDHTLEEPGFRQHAADCSDENEMRS